MLNKLIYILLVLYALFFISKNTFAQSVQNKSDQVFEGVIVKIIDEKEKEINGKKQLYQKLQINLTTGSLKNKNINIENGNIPLANIQRYKVGDQVILTYSKDAQGKDYFYINDFVRRKPLFFLFLIFIILVILVGRYRGIASLVSMVVSFYFIFSFILPQISAGANPITIVLLASLFVIPITFYLSHGLNKKTTIAIIATFISLIIAGILTSVFTEATRLTGFVSEEAAFLQVTRQGVFNMRDLLMAGIIVSILGVLDDITVAQSAIVFQLKEVNRKLNFREIYTKAMNVGQDHITSMVNTLILVYAGASLPLLLLFIDNPKPFDQVINHEIVAEAIVRMFVGSISLILCVPITTLIASFYASREKN